MRQVTFPFFKPNALDVLRGLASLSMGQFCSWCKRDKRLAHTFDCTLAIVLRDSGSKVKLLKKPLRARKVS